MITATLVAIALASLIVCCQADMYLHNPRGSNNRLNEARATRQTNNRVFDSQNNARGGYNVGDKTNNKAGNNAANQYQMEYMMSGATKNDVTKFIFEWTNQHGCGGNEDTNPSKCNCDVIIQYAVEDKTNDAAYSTGKFEMRDGTNTARQDYTNNNGNLKDGVRRFTENQGAYNNRKNGNVKNDRAYQEPHEWYDRCRARPRNNGLYTADQNVKENRATHTRQNANGNRNGYECAEERDHYPYWHPTGWKDIMVFTKNKSRCDSFYKKESFNIEPKYECVEKWPNTQVDRHYSGAETEVHCTTLGGKWVEFWNYLEMDNSANSESACIAKNGQGGYSYKWAIPFRYAANNREEKKCLVLLEAPNCDEAPFSRQNHLGNGADLEPLRYEFNMPHFPSGETKHFVFRIRYNISTDDYDPHHTDHKSNNNPEKDVFSPVTQNPLVDVGVGHALQLAINTAQFGRTFQDRSHLSKLIKRPAEVTGIVHNLNVRGKRGNIVQTFPAVEYDFMPTELNIKQADHVHIQWTGSNSHNNGNPAGDGQAGDAGQGTGGTDRTNIVGLSVKDDNFPGLMEKTDNICHHLNVVWQKSEGKKTMEWSDIA